MTPLRGPMFDLEEFGDQYETRRKLGMGRSKMPDSTRHINRRLQKYAAGLGRIVEQLRGRVTVADVHHIEAAETAWKNVLLIRTYLARYAPELSHAERLRYMEKEMVWIDKRDRAVQRLGLFAKGAGASDPVADALASLDNESHTGAGCGA